MASNRDLASLNIAKQILNNYPFRRANEVFDENPIYEAEINGKAVKLVTLNQESIYAQNLNDFCGGSELIIFVSRHSSESGTPTLSVHTPGNLGKADKGGLPRKVSFSPANAMRDALKTMMELKRELQLDYEVSYECTHHGPSLNAPSMFVELGSSPKQWSDLKAAEVVAHAAMKAISLFGKSKASVALGVGGPHYNEKFTRMALENEIAFGHIIPKYALSYVDLEIVRQCVEKTLERVDFAVLDWKGIRGEYKQGLVAMLEDIGLSIKKV
ncbi:MAG: D-aminoacyl-tRNA deacylase [Candidatus Bathyarchaeia archaeon]